MLPAAVKKSNHVHRLLGCGERLERPDRHQSVECRIGYRNRLRSRLWRARRAAHSAHPMQMYTPGVSPNSAM